MTAAQPASAAPSTVVTAARLWLASAALEVVSIVVSLVVLPQTVALVREQVARQVAGRDTAGLDVDAIATATVAGTTAIAVLLGLAFAVLTVVFSRRLLRGRNWARIVLLVFAVLHVPALLGALGPGTGVLQVAAAVLQVLVAGTAAVLTFLPASQPWFRRTLLPPTAA